MSSDPKKAQDTGKKTASQEKPKAVSNLEPCDKPQAAEVSRLQAEDDACDDGVH
jgi:hypothetical protein